MNKKNLTLITSLIWSAIYYSSKNIITNITTTYQCKLGVQKFNKKTINYKDNKNLKIYIYSDQVQLEKIIPTITAIGNIKYISNDIKLKVMKKLSILNTKDIYFYNLNNQIVSGRCKAETLKKIYKNRYKFIKNFIFTSCIQNYTNFSIVGSKFIYDIFTIWNARFKIFKLPFFYSPYLKIKVGKKRYSGFILPYLKKNRNCFIVVNIPYYLNIAKHYDLTITTFMSKRCNKLQAELRYLNNQDKGLVEFYFLPNDKKDNFHNDEIKTNNNNSWLLYCKYTGIKDKLWRLNINYTKLSNLKYFNDIESKYCNNSYNERYTTQKLCIGYTNKNFNTYLSSKKFKILKNGINNTYSVTPQLDISYYKKNIYYFNFKIISKAAKFNNISSNYPEILILHIEPNINLQLSNNWGILNTEAKLMMTNFNQKNIQKYNNKQNKNHNTNYLDSKVNSLLPQFKTEIKFFFDRYMDYSSYYIQTLEPRFQYLYVPYYNHNNIFIYNSTLLHKDYNCLFIDKKYSNIDLISSANQLTSCFTTIIYDYSLNEKFIASLGQRYYFSQQIENINNKKNLLLTADSYWCINNNFVIQGGIQYDSYINKLTLSDAILESKIYKNNIFKIHYRYVNKKNLENFKIIKLQQQYKLDIAKIGIIYNWKPIDHFSIIGSYFYDSQFNNTIKKLFCVEYKTCGWSINVAYERKIFFLNKNNKNINNYNNKILLKFELIGLNR